MGDRLYIKMDGLVNRSCDKITIIGAVIWELFFIFTVKVMRSFYLQGEGHNVCHSSNNGFKNSIPDE